MVTRLLTAGTVVALSAAALGTRPTASAAAPGSQAVVHSPLVKPVKLDRKNAQLKLVQVVFRHGARTPLSDSSYLWGDTVWNVGGQPFESVPIQLVDVKGGRVEPNDHDKKQVSSILPGGAHKGELTTVGHLQALELGYWLRQQYIDLHGFLPPVYKSGILSARTTNFARTKATMAGVLTGLYPGTEESIPVITSGDLDEILYADTKRCPHLKVLMQASEAMLKANWQSPDRAPRMQALQQQLDGLFDLPQGAWDKRWMITDIHDAITSLSAHGKELPVGLSQDMKDEIDKLATEEIKAFICPALVDDHGHAVMRLSMGRLLDTLLANMDSARSTAQVSAALGVPSTSSSGSSGGKSSGQQQHQQHQQHQRRLYMYSGHDSTVMPLLTALGADIDRWPPYISNLVFELWELKPPTINPKNNMGTSSSSSGSASGSGSGSSSKASSSGSCESNPGVFAVRVLYNKQPLQLPGASEANPTLLELQDFRDQVLAPFLLSEAQHAEACAATISHDQALPQPKEDDWNLAGGSSAAGGGEKGQQQQQQQQQQQKKQSKL